MRTPRPIPASVLVSLALSALLALLPTPLAAQADTAPRLGLLGDVSLLAAPDAGLGTALELGARVRIGAHALTAELGYGVLGSDGGVQDRWWILASYAWRVRLDAGTTLELGGGLGVAASSGYADLDAFVAAPFDPTWARQLAPAATGRTALAFAIDDHVELFVALRVGALLDTLGPHALGLQEGTVPSAGDRLWGTLSIGTTLE